MNINQLETLITISKTMSFRKAGELLNLTQPAVSAQIKSLEDEFGTVLVDRNQPVSLTDTGMLFLEHAEQILSIVNDLKLKLTDMKATPQGHIRLGTTSSIAIQILPRVLSYFKNQYPLIKTTIHSMPSMLIMSSVENGTIDIGIGYLSEKAPGLNTSVLYYDSFELVASPQHPLAQRNCISIKELQGAQFVMLSPDTAGRRYLDAMLEKYGVEIETVMELSSGEEVKRMVELNMGVAVISKMSALIEKTGSLKLIKVEEFDSTHPVGVVTKTGKYLNSAMKQFLNDLMGMPENQFLGTE